MEKIAELIVESHEVIYGFPVTVEVSGNQNFVTIDRRFTLKRTKAGLFMGNQIAKYNMKNRRLKPMAWGKTRFLSPDHIDAIACLMKILYEEPGELQIAKANNWCMDDGDGLTSEIKAEAIVAPAPPPPPPVAAAVARSLVKRVSSSLTKPRLEINTRQVCYAIAGSWRNKTVVTDIYRQG